MFLNIPEQDAEGKNKQRKEQEQIEQVCKDVRIMQTDIKKCLRVWKSNEERLDLRSRFRIREPIFSSFGIQGNLRNCN